MAPTRYERTSELIKAFKQVCTRNREEFQTLEMELADFTAVLDELTKNTCVLIIVHDPTIGEWGRFVAQTFRWFGRGKLTIWCCRNGCFETKYSPRAQEVRGAAREQSAFMICSAFGCPRLI